jgi:hypothetical protein
MPEWVTASWWTTTCRYARERYTRRKKPIAVGGGLFWAEAEHVACKKGWDAEDIWPGFNEIVDTWTQVLEEEETARAAKRPRRKAAP